MEPILLTKGEADISFRRNGTEIVAALVVFFLGGTATRQQFLYQGSSVVQVEILFYQVGSLGFH